MTINHSQSLGGAAEWATNDVWILRQKDTEPRSADPMNYLDPDDPLVDFAKFVNGESVMDEDL